MLCTGSVLHWITFMEWCQEGNGAKKVKLVFISTVEDRTLETAEDFKQ